jgi:ABC-type sugar transport system substrate-binding protein
MSRTARNTFVALTAALLLAAPVGLDAADAPQPAKPTIIFVLTAVT